MKSLPIKSKAFLLLHAEYESWLTTLNYAASSIYYLTNHVQEFLHFCEQQQKDKIRDISTDTIKEYLYHLQQRRNERQGGGLSIAYLKKHMQAITLLTGYLRKQYHLLIPATFLSLGNDKNDPEVLTQQEIRSLYDTAATIAAKPAKNNTPVWLPEALHLRDKAMLGIYYGCGLRRNEGVQLDASDINWSNSILHVRKGKNYKERFVPIPRKVQQDLEQYHYESRPLLRKANKKDNAFLIGTRGHRISGQTLLLRLQLLADHSDSSTLQQKKPGLHTLRHSIATHLLQNGMTIEAISEFLGHSSLESTQLYTHLIPST